MTDWGQSDERPFGPVHLDCPEHGTYSAPPFTPCPACAEQGGVCVENIEQQIATLRRKRNRIEARIAELRYGRPALPEERGSDDPVLCGLADCAANKRVAVEWWERALEAAIRAGHSERLIAKAAGVSGPAVHARKKKLAEADNASRVWCKRCLVFHPTRIVHGLPVAACPKIERGQVDVR